MQLVQLIAEYFKAICSWIVKQGDFLEWFAAFGVWVAGIGSFTAAWIALHLGITANQAKLKTTAKYEKEVEAIKIEIENIGPRKVIVYHLEMCRVKKRGIGLYGCKREYNGCMTVHSDIAHPDINEVSPQQKLRLYLPSLLPPRDPPSDPPTILSDSPSGVLGVGKSGTWIIPLSLDERAYAGLAEFVSSKKEAKTVGLVVCTDHGKFPVNQKCVKKILVSTIISAIGRKANAPPSTGK